MSKNRTRSARSTIGTLTRRRRVLAIAVVFSIIATGAIWAQRSLHQSTRSKLTPQQDATITAASFDPSSPSKEYIYAGASLVATEEPTGSGCGSTLLPTNQTFSPAAATSSVTVTISAGCGWTAVSNATTWVTITTGSTGTGSGTVGYSVATNTGASRTGTITIAGQTFTVNQSQAGCGSFSISPPNVSYTAPAASGSVAVTGAAGCTWSATTNDSWITITSGASGSGNGTVNYSVASNGTSSTRTGTMTAAGQTFTVTQTGVGCSFSISPAGQSFASAGGTGSVTVTSAAGCAWTAGSNPAWITITSGSSGSGTGNVNYSVVSNGGTSRTGTITIAGQTFTVTQSAANCFYSISPLSQSFASGGGAGTVTVTADPGCTWTAGSNPSWVAFNSTTSGTGNGSVNYTVGVNTGVARTGTIIIAGKTFTLTQAAGVTGGCNTISMSPPTQSVAKAGGTFTVNAVSPVPAGCNWTATSSVSWITIISGGNGAGTGTITYTVAAYVGGTVTRQGLITIATVGGPATLSVKQSP